MSNLSGDLVARSIGFHGLPLQKMWEGERGDGDLARYGVVNPDFTAYQQRQKQFSFQDRAKRLKLHQFIARKANVLFSGGLLSTTVPPPPVADSLDGICAAATPSLETFLHSKIEKSMRLQHILSLLSRGDVIYGTVSSKTGAGLVIKLLCTGPPCVRIFSDMNAKAFLPNVESIPAIDRKALTRSYITNDLVCCEVLEVHPLNERMVVGMQGTYFNGGAGGDLKLPFGLTATDQLPEMYKLSLNGKFDSYEHILETSPGFRNPHCIEHLANSVGLDTSVYYTNMSGLRGRFAQQEYGSDLRQVQASKWAFRSVAEGIEHFKEGRHSEAFQCLNKALNIDPRNVEGLVARGALYANSGSFKKAVDDFETALKLNASHANARKYMGETLVALGRSYEDENKIDEAKKAYQDCLAIIPRHEEAQNSLDFLRNKGGKQLIEPNDLTLPERDVGIGGGSGSNMMMASGSGIKKDDNRGGNGSSAGGKDKKMKKKKSKNRRRRSSSSTSSTDDDSSDSSDSSSGSSSSSDSSTSSDSNHSKYKKKQRAKRPKSLSPFSKRMSMMPGGGVDNLHGNMAAAVGGGGGFDLSGPPNSFNFNHSYGGGMQQLQHAVVGGIGGQMGDQDEYEARVRKFLELTRDEDNYEDKVRKFVEEATKYRKDRRINDEKAARKREKRKNRKLKKDSKKKRKEKKSKTAKKEKDDAELREALKIIKNLPVFDMTSKLNAVEQSLGLLQEQEQSLQIKEEKWKMMFKDDRKLSGSVASSVSGSAIPSTNKLIPKQYVFGNDDDTDVDQHRGGGGGSSFGGITRAAAGSSSTTSRKSPDRKKSTAASSSSSARPSTPPPTTTNRSKYGGSATIAAAAAAVAQPPKAPVGQVVLDKFGNFRLASQEKPPEPNTASTRRSSRSRSPRRRYSSDSRSRSPTTTTRRRSSRSRSYERRRRSRSRSGRSRSRSYSRSRSGSLDRRRGGSERYSRGGLGRNTSTWYDRGTYYKPRVSNSRGNRGVVPFNRGGYSSNRDYTRDYRGGGRGGRDTRYRGSGSSWAPRGGRYDRRRSRSRSRSYDSGGGGGGDDRSSKRSPVRDRQSDKKRDSKKSSNNTTSSDKDKEKEKSSGDGAVAAPAASASTGPTAPERDSSLEEIEKIIDKGKKEMKDEMIERNKDLVKKSAPIV